MDYCDECASEHCPGHPWCENCDDEMCTECGGCSCPETYCPGYPSCD
ncbi:hypothetical protein ACPCTO_13585 [Streptomyces olivoreticuli]